VDWRADHNSLSYEVIELPTQVEEGIRAFMAELGLKYGAFDFVVGPGGVYTFLECNSSGQFGWLEGVSGLPITEALVGLLVAGGDR
jgi:glutathione synthase/RimK-type ligase-like ATP-grasp enzyme